MNISFKYIAIFISLWCISLFTAVDLRAQVPIENLLAKYSDIEKLESFNLTDQQLKVSKQISLNLDEEQKYLIKHTDAQYTLLYTGSNPSLSSFYEEAIDILKSKQYLLGKKSKLPNSNKVLYYWTENGNITDIVFVIQDSNCVSIIASKGNFNDYKAIDKTTQIIE